MDLEHQLQAKLHHAVASRTDERIAGRDIGCTTGPRAQLQVIGPGGQPATGARVLVRDRDATLHLERRYKTDKKGTTNIDLVSAPTVVVVVYGDIVSTTELAQRDLNPIIRLSNH
jgi:hypothetical protein